MKRVRALRNFVEYVPGVGIVVGNAARKAAEATAEHPCRKAREADIVSVTPEKAVALVASGKAEYADAYGENEGDEPVRRRKTQKERRLDARAARHARKAGRESDPAEGDELEGDDSGEALPELTDADAGEEKSAPARRRGRRAPANTDAPVD